MHLIHWKWEPASGLLPLWQAAGAQWALNNKMGVPMVTVAWFWCDVWPGYRAASVTRSLVLTANCQGWWWLCWDCGGWLQWWMKEAHNDQMHLTGRLRTAWLPDSRLRTAWLPDSRRKDAAPLVQPGANPPQHTCFYCITWLFWTDLSWWEPAAVYWGGRGRDIKPQMTSWPWRGVTHDCVWTCDSHAPDPWPLIPDPWSQHCYSGVCLCVCPLLFYYNIHISNCPLSPHFIIYGHCFFYLLQSSF